LHVNAHGSTARKSHPVRGTVKIKEIKKLEKPISYLEKHWGVRTGEKENKKAPEKTSNWRGRELSLTPKP